MYEDITYEVLLRRMLAVALEKNPKIDPREGSVVWLGQAPSAVELQNVYIALDQILNETFADTASRESLVKRAKERGLAPYPATKMVGRGKFSPTSIEIPIGTRFSLNALNYSVKEKTGAGVYTLECETAGEGGNESLGTMIPVDYISGLETAQLTELLIPGEDDEDTELFRTRYFNSLDAQAFGGNVADYIERVNAISGVGGVKVYRAWNGGIKPATLVPPAAFSGWFAGLGTETPAEVTAWLRSVSAAAQGGFLTVGGTIRLVIIDATFSQPTATLIGAVQTEIDPAEHHAEGVGIAPIGHFVTVAGVTNAPVSVAFTITYQSGWAWKDVKPYAEESVDVYFKSLSKGWAGSSDPIVVRISQLETRLLACPGVLDVSGTTLNGTASNLVLGADNIPTRSELSG